MDPLTIGLLIGGGYLLLKGSAPAPVVPVASGPAPIQSTPGSVIQYSGSGVAPPRGDSSTSASPIEASGYIPPYVSVAGPSAVVLAGLGSCGCASCMGGLGDVKSDRKALHAQLKALRVSFRAQIQTAIKANNPSAVRAIVAQMRAQMKALLDAYHLAHPHVTPTAPSVAPNFMAKDHRRRTDIHTGV